jgi:hypothetical protein
MNYGYFSFYYGIKRLKQVAPIKNKETSPMSNLLFTVVPVEKQEMTVGGATTIPTTIPTTLDLTSMLGTFNTNLGTVFSTIELIKSKFLTYFPNVSTYFPLKLG